MDINNILKARQIVEKYQQANASHSKQEEIEMVALKGLAELGFKSFSDFYEANKQANIAEAKRCYKITGHCDQCKGRTKGCLNLTCEERDKAATVTGNVSFDDVVVNFFRLRNLPNHAPPGCAIKATEIAKPSFDIYWGFPPAWTVTEYNQLLKDYPWAKF